MGDKLTREGSYVLATKYKDGDPCDHFFVGWVTGMTWHGRYLCADAPAGGENQRGNGFRRAEPITGQEGHWLVSIFPSITDKPGPSLWEHLDEIRRALDAAGGTDE